MEYKLEFNMKLPLNMKKEGIWYIACCPILDIHTQGETKAKAKRNLAEAISLFFLSCFERGVLDEALKECGFRPFFEKSSSHHSVKVCSEAQKKSIPGAGYVNVPVPFLLEQASRECRV